MLGDKKASAFSPSAWNSIDRNKIGRTSMNNGYSTTPHPKTSLRIARAALSLLAVATMLCWTAPNADARSKKDGREKRLRSGPQWFDKAIRDYVPLMIVVSLST